MSDPPLSDIDFKNKMARVWTTLKYEKSRVKLTRENILFESNCSVMSYQLSLQHLFK